MTTYFIGIDQTVEIDAAIAKKWLSIEDDKGVTVQFNFAVPSGSVGFEIQPKNWVEGGVTLSREKNSLQAVITGLAKINLFEMQEKQIAEKVPVYIATITAVDGMVGVPVLPEKGPAAIVSQGEKYTVALLSIGKTKKALASYSA